MTLDADTAPAALEALHREVDDAVRPLTAALGDRLRCKLGCSDCCVDDLSVFEVEAQRIRSAYPKLLADGQPHAEGACAFLDEAGACRVYKARPYVCRTQGLPLRWVQEGEDDEVHEMRDICTLNEPGTPELVELPTERCWQLGPFEGRLATLQVGLTKNPDRVRLRDLFSS